MEFLRVDSQEQLWVSDHLMRTALLASQQLWEMQVLKL